MASSGIIAPPSPFAAGDVFFVLCPFPCFAIAVETGPRFVLSEVNEAWTKCTGLTAEFVIGREPKEYLPPDVAGLASQRMEACVVAQRPVDFTEALTFPSGTHIWHTHLAPVLGANGHVVGLAGWAEDLTEQHRSEDSRRESEERYRLLFENMTNGFALHEIIVDAEGRPRDYRYLEANPAFQRLTGVDVTRLIGKTVLEVLPGTEDHWIQTFGRVALQGESLFYEDYSRDIGRYFATWTFSPRQGQFAVIFSDVTDRRNAELALARSEQKYRQLVERLHEGIWHINAEGAFVYVNARMAEMLGRTVTEILGKPLISFLSPAVQTNAQAWLDRLGRGGDEQYELEFKERNGGSVFALAALAPLYNDDGVYAGALAGLQDITARKRAEQDRAALERHLQETQKLQSLGVLAGGIAHDFNNLLTGILGAASLARPVMGSDPDAARALGYIETASLRAADLCRQLLAYAGKGRFVIEPLNISRLVRETVQLLALTLKAATIQFDLDDAVPAVAADATQIRQVLMNLVQNASDALAESGGIIRIKTRFAPVSGDELRSLASETDLPAGRYILLEIADNGPGMSPETLRRIFEPYFTTKFAGRGLGLSAVLGIVRGHKGAIAVESSPGSGTVFRLLFPPTDIAVPPQTIARVQETWHGHGAILLVDDEEIVRTITRRMLMLLGFEVLLARDGVEALALADAEGARLRAVLMDLTMPKMDGEAAFRVLREKHPDLKVLMMSGYDEEAAARRFTGAGLAGFVQKPFTIEVLRDRLRESLD